MVQLAADDLSFMDGESFAMSVPCVLQEVKCGMNELLQGAEVHVASVYVLSQYFVGEIYDHFLNFVKADWILQEM